MEVIITSRHNLRVKSVLALRRRRDREAAGVTLIEGFEELSLALASGVRPTTLFYCFDLMGDQSRQDLLKKIAHLGTELLQVSREVFEKLAYRESPDGWLAIAPALQTNLRQLKLGETPLLLVCESVEKPGNLGAILRTADAAGVDAVIATDAATDWGNPNIVRASKGAVFSTQIASTTNEELLAWLRERDIKIIATTPDTETSYTQADLTGPVAIFVGTEKHGLSDFWLKNADIKTLIPMVGKIDSLNVATSAALLAYEAVRQRTK